LKAMKMQEDQDTLLLKVSHDSDKEETLTRFMRNGETWFINYQVNFFGSARVRLLDKQDRKMTNLTPASLLAGVE
jgi:hypothetical protein